MARRTKVRLPPPPPILGVMPVAPPGALIALEQQRLNHERERGTRCSCCGQHVKVYPRPVNSSMARWLIDLCRKTTVLADGSFTWTNVKVTKARGGDYAKLLYWGLIEKQTPADGRNSGLFRPTAAGIEFAQRRTRVVQYIFLYNKQLLGWGGEFVDIVTALGKKFDYDALMRGEG